MNLQEYIESKRPLYAEFARCVAGIIEAALTTSGTRGTVQQIQSRAKGVESLSRKLNARDQYELEAIENEVKDLAGCRLVFYHNDDLNAFLHSGIVSENFDVDWHESKIHHPDSEAQTANDFYMANHYLVALKADRLCLPEFAKFAGLRCEIQAQTLLNHAWSETIHDITYKNPKAPGFGDELMSRIDERLMKIMTDHLRPAGYEFQKVKHDFAQLMTGQEIFDKDIFNLIRQAEDSNALFELLERYRDYVIPNYSDFSSYTDQMYAVIEVALNQARALGDAPIDTPYGLFDGKSHADILTISLQILSFIRYLDFDKTHELLVQIHNDHVDPLEEDIFSEYVDKIAAYHDDIIQKYGYFVQTRLVEALTDRSDTDLSALSRYVLAVCAALLAPTISKTEWSYKEVALGKINLPGTPELAEIRQGALEILQRLANSSGRSARKGAVACMRRATETPHVGNYDDALLNIIIENTNSVIQFLIGHLDREDLETIQADEEWMLRLHVRAQEMLANSKLASDTLQRAEETKSLTGQYRSTVAGISDYEQYKVLVGFRSVFDQEWDDERWGWEEKEKFREEKIGEFVDSITEHNIGDWIRFFSICVKADATDGATFQHFTRFLEKFATQKPDLARQALQDTVASLQGFMHIILLGFAEADRDDLFEAVAKEFIDSGDRLWECARPFVLSPLQNRVVLHRVFASAVEHEYAPVLYQVIAAVVTNRESIGDELDTLFLPALRFLTERKDAGWIREAWFRKDAILLLRNLDEQSSGAILDNLVFLPELDHDAERLIEPIAQNHPTLVLAFFGNRLDIENQKDPKERYDAIPYDFQLLSAPLSAVPEMLVDVALGWFQREARMFQYRGANLISNTFPDFDDSLEKKLLELITTGDEQLLDFVVSILRNYKGQIFLHSICKQIVVEADLDSRHVRNVMSILEESGTMSGEYGFADRCSRKKQEIKHWLEDDDSKVRAFAERYIRGLDRQRAAELRRVEEDIELQKHQYE